MLNVDNMLNGCFVINNLWWNVDGLLQIDVERGNLFIIVDLLNKLLK